MPTTNANGITINYDTFGAHDATPLLLIQGLGAQMVGWHHEFCAMLADRGYHVVRFDNRDVGRSSWCTEEYALRDMADDAAALIEGLDLAPAHVVGQSMGGMIAQALALGHPHAVRSLGLIYTSPSLAYVNTSPEYRSSRTAPATTREGALAQFVENERWCASTGYVFNEAWISELGALSYDRGYNPAGIDRQLRALDVAPDRTEALTKLDVPTIVLHGDADQLIDLAGGRALAEAIPGARLEVFAGLGHEIAPPLWERFVDLIAGNAAQATAKRDDGEDVAA